MENNIIDEMLAELLLNQMMNGFRRSKILEKINQSLKSKDK